MKRFLVTLLVLLCGAVSAAEVPKGVVTKYTFEGSKVFPGTVRDYWVYVPAQYDPAKPACLHVNQDGIQFNAPAVFDQLIAAGEMPVTVGLFVTPGKVKALSTNALDRFNRSFEYDGLGDNYARFILDELLPRLVAEQKLNLSTNGNDRSIGGSSSGAICAFTAAWERPDAFRRVFSAIGTYVGLRGGDGYPTLIRKTEPKPLRVFLQDGSADLNIYGGDWWMANQTMERALAFAGYEVNHMWGDGGHSGKQATEIFADAMRWLWKDWPAPVKAGPGSKQMQEILLPGEDWQVVFDDRSEFATHCAANAKGEVFFSALRGIHRIAPDGKVAVARDDIKEPAGLAFGPDGRFFVVARHARKLIACDADGKSTVIADDFQGEDVVVSHDGSIYVTEPTENWDWDCGFVWWVRPGAKPERLWVKMVYTGGIALSPDQSLLYINDFASQWVDSFQLQADGSPTNQQHYDHLHVPDTPERSGAGGMCVDRDGRLYVATAMGVQVCDQAGRVNCILPTPNGQCRGLCFGGADFDTLFAACNSKVFKRKLKVRGANAFEPPVKPVTPKL